MPDAISVAKMIGMSIVCRAFPVDGYLSGRMAGLALRVLRRQAIGVHPHVEVELRGDIVEPEPAAAPVFHGFGEIRQVLQFVDPLSIGVFQCAYVDTRVGRLQRFQARMRRRAHAVLRFAFGQAVRPPVRLSPDAVGR
ncbi:hypothetical protein [Burkholderia ubonensis]|uniref:hypothetical protein n=1 Tax=Burkholderia ubonensis TaxID=101571 RepID=UPI001055781E|nr:hypothetical protein [Burkholderia ubonensis]